MPTPVKRQSLVIDLQTRYATQPAGGAFNVKTVLGQPGNSPAPGTIINATSIQGKTFQSPAGFEVKAAQMSTQFLDAQGTTSKQLSVYIHGFTNQKYKP